MWDALKVVPIACAIILVSAISKIAEGQTVASSSAEVIEPGEMELAQRLLNKCALDTRFMDAGSVMAMTLADAMRTQYGLPENAIADYLADVEAKNRKAVPEITAQLATHYASNLTTAQLRSSGDVMCLEVAREMKALRSAAADGASALAGKLRRPDSE